MISSIVFAVDYDSETGKITITTEKGWNIVPIAAVKSDYSTNQNCFSDNLMKISYYYSPYLKKYVGPGLSMTDTPENYNIFIQDMERKYYTANYYLGAIWVYADKPCTYIGELGTPTMFNQNSINQLKIVQGWNFINISPWMIGKTLPSIFKNCTITGRNMWINSGTSAYWYYPSSSRTDATTFSDDTSIIPKEAVGTTFIIKVASDCTLNYGSETTIPPSLPN